MKETDIVSESLYLKKSTTVGKKSVSMFLATAGPGKILEQNLRIRV
jgi:hypothetical protein